MCSFLLSFVVVVVIVVAVVIIFLLLCFLLFCFVLLEGGDVLLVFGVNRKGPKSASVILEHIFALVYSSEPSLHVYQVTTNGKNE